MVSLEINGEVLIKSTPEDIKAFEVACGFELPSSYKDFSLNLGFGLMCGIFLTYIPYNSCKCDSLANRNKAIKKIFNSYLIDRNEFDFLEPEESYLLLKHAEPFSFSENGEFLFWDIRENVKNEYPIYLVDFPIGIYRCGNSIDEFIENITSPATFKSIMKFWSEPLPKTFKPYSAIY